MKLLLVYCKNFGYSPAVKTLDSASEDVLPDQYQDVQVAFIQVEKEDAPGFPLARVFKNI